MNDWELGKFEGGLYPTIIFKDPNDNRILIVMTNDENRSDFVCRSNYKLRQNLLV